MALATCDVFPAVPTGQAHMLTLQTCRATSSADNIALWLVHCMSAQAYPSVVGESDYKGVLTN